MAHEILNFKSENEDLPFYDITFLYFLYHYYITILAGMQVKPTEQVKTAYMITTYEFPNIPLEKPILAFGLGKRSGCPEQWPKIGEKYDLTRKNRPF